MPRLHKKDTYEFIKSNVDLMTLDEMASELKITKQRVHQYCKTYGISRKIKTLGDAMKEIRRLKNVPHETLTEVKLNLLLT